MKILLFKNYLDLQKHVFELRARETEFRNRYRDLTLPSAYRPGGKADEEKNGRILNSHESETFN